jgi:hypothetical protein
MARDVSQAVALFSFYRLLSDFEVKVKLLSGSSMECSREL